MLRGRIHIGPDIDTLERAFDDAKYGGISRRPYLDVTIPTLTDPSLAPAGGHVMSVYAQYTPYRLKTGAWPERAGEVGEAVLATLEEYAPGLRGLVVSAQVLTPLAPRARPTARRAATRRTASPRSTSSSWPALPRLRALSRRPSPGFTSAAPAPTPAAASPAARA